MNNYYEYIEKVKFKDYKINDNHNELIFKNLMQIDQLSKIYNLNYIVTGSCALVFYTNKIYRDIKDLDLIIDINSLSKWLSILIEIYDFSFLGEPVEFFEHCLENNRLLPFIHKKNKIKLEICAINKSHKWYPKNIFTKNINSINYNYCLPLKMKKEKGLFHNRERDFDDLKFYSDLIN